jgi:preprotein translocase subunit SecD
MLANRRRSIRLYLPALAITLVLLYLALLGVQSSTAKMMPAVMTFEATQSASTKHLTVASDVLGERISSYLPNDAQPTVTVKGNRLAISLPSDVEPSIVVAEANRIGRVELVDSGTEFLPLNRTVQTGPRAIPDQNVYQAVLTSADFEVAEAKLIDGGRPAIDFVLSPAGDARLFAHTAELSGYYLCLVVDNRVTNCPILRTPLTDRHGTIELTGDATLDDARTLAMLIRSGPLPVPLKLTTD